MFKKLNIIPVRKGKLLRARDNEIKGNPNPTNGEDADGGKGGFRGELIKNRREPRRKEDDEVDSGTSTIAASARLDEGIEEG